MLFCERRSGKPASPLLCLLCIPLTIIRWRIVWQDSLLSITFDRAPSTFTIATAQAHDPSFAAGDDRLSYVESMKALCTCILNIIRDRSEVVEASQEVPSILKHRDRLAAVSGKAASYLTDLTCCRSLHDQLEHWNFAFHFYYVMAALYRPALAHHDSLSDLSLRQACITNLGDTVQAFLGLQNVSHGVRTSWAAMQRAISSGLLLGIMKEQARSPRINTLMQKLLAVIEEVNSDNTPSEVPAPITRAVEALRTLLTLQPGMDVDTHHWVLKRQEFVKRSSVSGEPRTYETSRLALSSTSSAATLMQSPYAVIDDIMWGSGITTTR